MLALEARFMRRTGEGTAIECEAADADGVWFLCPKCYHANAGSVGTHHVMCWFEGRVPDNANPGPGRWTPNGRPLEDLSFVPGKTIHATSVQLTGGCGWHGHISKGCATVPNV